MCIATRTSGEAYITGLLHTLETRAPILELHERDDRLQPSHLRGMSALVAHRCRSISPPLTWSGGGIAKGFYERSKLRFHGYRHCDRRHYDSEDNRSSTQSRDVYSVQREVVSLRSQRCRRGRREESCSSSKRLDTSRSSSQEGRRKPKRCGLHAQMAEAETMDPQSARSINFGTF